MGTKLFRAMAKEGIAVLAFLLVSTPVARANETLWSDSFGFSQSYSERQLIPAQQFQGNEEILSNSTSFPRKPLGQRLTVAQVQEEPEEKKGEKDEPLPELIPLGQPEVQKGPRYFGEKFEERLLDLGVNEDFTLLERNLFKAQVKSFIPPLFVPAVAGHAFVLPPGLFQVATNFTFTNISGDDFNKDGHNDPIHEMNGVRRQFLTLSLFYGFDLNRKYLHSFTARLNIPWQNSQTRGPVLLPDEGNGSRQVFNAGNAQGLGDISFFLKKKLLDQANENRLFGIPFPIGVAVAAGVFFPTGSNQAKAGTDGRIRVEGPGFGPGGPSQGSPASITPIFGRFSDDGRLPSDLQPGNGDFSFQIAGFVTRQFVPGDMPDFLAGTTLDRAAIHLGGFARFHRADDGFSRGNTYVAFFTGVVPVYKDFVSLQVHNINTVQNRDSYEGTFAFPNTFTAPPGPPASAPKRPSFRGGWTSLLGPSLVFSPDPLIRMTATALFRIKEPELGPSPPYVINFGTSFIF